MRADRLLSLLFLLQTHGRMSAPDLAGRLEVSTRTVLRDVEALSTAGVPVYTEQGRGGGISLLENWRTDVSGFTTAEARALFSGTTGTHDPQRPAWDSALRKLLAATPENRREPLQRAAERIIVEPAGWRTKPRNPPHLAELQEAVFGAKRLKVQYRSAGATRNSTRTLDPVGLVAKGGTWYLVGLVKSEPRLLRADRVRSVTILDEPTGELPDLARTWEELRQHVERPEVPTIRTRLRVATPDVGLLLRIVDAQLVTEPEIVDLGEHHEIVAEFRALGAARGVLLGFGTSVRVLEPPELVADLVRTAREVQSSYEE